MLRRIAVTLMGLVGFVLAFGVATFTMWDELLRRIQHSRAGGTGETADWGQPAFFILVIGTAPGIAGAAGLAILTRMLVRFRRSTDARTPTDD